MNKLKCFFCQRRLRSDKGRSAHIRISHPVEAANKELLREKFLEEMRSSAAEDEAEERRQYPFGKGQWSPFDDLDGGGGDDVMYDVDCFGRHTPSDADQCPDETKEYYDLREAQDIGSEHARKTGHEVGITRRKYASAAYYLDEATKDAPPASTAIVPTGESTQTKPFVARDADGQKVVGVEVKAATVAGGARRTERTTMEFGNVPPHQKVAELVDIASQSQASKANPHVRKEPTKVMPP